MAPPGELEALEQLARLLPPAPAGETWIGDDTAVLPLPPAGAGWLLFATDILVVGVHADLGLVSAADAGWKALASNLSDIAAMGGLPWRCVAAVAGASSAQLAAISEGIVAAAERFGCPLVGGDLAGGDKLVVSVAILGTTATPPVLRSGARPGDALFVTGPLGASAAGLRQLRADAAATGEAVEAHRRPQPRLAEGVAAAVAGASTMLDLSDGLGLDANRLALASGVGLDLDEVPVAPGATEDEAIGGGEDYELLFAAPDEAAVLAAFAKAALRRPILIGRCVQDPSRRDVAGRPLEPLGYEHSLG